MSEIKDLIIRKSEEIHRQVIDFRRDLHMYPELSYREFTTAEYLCKWLNKNNIQYTDKIAGTGILGRISGTGKGNKIVAVRAEMDALPVNERNDNDYISRNPGVMHACGHDAHMAVLMGSALVIKSLSEEFGGTLLLVFQPGEEKSPGGARLFIESGIFNNYKPDIILGTHNLPEITTGKTGYKAGRYMASCDEIYINVLGKGGHAALPGLTTDQILIASEIVVKIKEKTTRIAAERNIPTVLGIGRISGEGATNVIPEKVEIAGTFRTFDEKWRAECIEMIRQTAVQIAGNYGAVADVRIAEGYPVLVNDVSLTEKAMKLSEELLGRENVISCDVRMTSDDFSFYGSVAPSLYFRTGMGARMHDLELRKLHTPDFDIDEEGLKTGVSNMSWLIYNFLTT
jgi:amidohydrolase